MCSSNCNGKRGLFPPVFDEHRREFPTGIPVREMGLKRSQDLGFGFSRPAAIPLEATWVASMGITGTRNSPPLQLLDPRLGGAA